MITRLGWSSRLEEAWTLEIELAGRISPNGEDTILTLKMHELPAMKARDDVLALVAGLTTVFEEWYGSDQRPHQRVEMHRHFTDAERDPFPPPQQLN